MSRASARRAWMHTDYFYFGELTMKIKPVNKPLVTFIGAYIMLASVKAQAFIPPQSVVDQCIGAVEQKYAIQPQDLNLKAVRAQPVGDEAAVVYLHTSVTLDPAQRRVRMYCTIDKYGSVIRLRSNPRLLDVLK